MSLYFEPSSSSSGPSLGFCCGSSTAFHVAQVSLTGTLPITLYCSWSTKQVPLSTGRLFFLVLNGAIVFYNKEFCWYVRLFILSLLMLLYKVWVRFLVDEWKTNLMLLAILFHLLCAQHVSDINISIFRSLRLCWWITTSVVLFSKDGGFSN